MWRIPVAIGQPLLLTWRAADRAFRMYEFSTVNGFVQIATGNSGSYTGVGTATERTDEIFHPSFSFIDDSKSVLVISNMALFASVFRAVRRLHNPDTFAQKSNTLIADPGGGVNGNNAVYRNAFEVSRISNFCVSPATDVTGDVINACAVHGETNLKTMANVITNQNGSVDCLAFHPFDEFLFVCATPIMLPTIIPRRKVELIDGTSPGEYYPVMYDSTVDNDRTNITLREVVGDIVKAKWSASGKYLYLVGETGLLYVYEISQNPSDYTQVSAKLLSVNEITNDKIVNIDIRKDSHISISTYNVTGDTYTTFIYKIVGPVLIKSHTITEFGKCLNWVADGSMLVDAGTKRLFTFNESTETFAENSIWMTNVSAATDYQAVSTHAGSAVYVGHVYTEAAKLIAEQSSSINLGALKLMLFDKHAKFNPNIASIADIPTNGVSSVSNGGQEVYSIESGWLQGGISVNNAAYGLNANGESALIADNFERIVLANVTFQHAVIYDSITNKPIVWYEFMQEITVAAFKKMIFNLEQYGITSFK